MKKQFRNDFKKTKWAKSQKNQNSNRCSLRNVNFTYKIGQISSFLEDLPCLPRNLSFISKVPYVSKF